MSQASLSKRHMFMNNKYIPMNNEITFDVASPMSILKKEGVGSSILIMIMITKQDIIKKSDRL